MSELCQVCNKKTHTKLCDYAVGSGIVTSVDFKELMGTCDMLLCDDCATNLWHECDLCPDHEQEVRSKLVSIADKENKEIRSENSNLAYFANRKPPNTREVK